MEAKWSSLVSYGMSLDALKDFLPLEVTLDVKTVRYDTLKVAKRLEAELGDEQQRFITSSPSDWDLLSPPDGSCKVGIDGGYVRNWCAKKHHCEIIVGKSTLSFREGEADKAPSSKRFGSLVFPGVHNRMIFLENKEYPYKSNWTLWNKCVTFKIP